MFNKFLVLFNVSLFPLLLNNSYKTTNVLLEEKVEFNNYNYFNIDKTILEFTNNNDYFIGEIPLKFSTSNSKFYLSLTYKNIHNEEVLFDKELDMKNYINPLKLDYNFKFSILKKEINSNSNFTFKVKAPLLHHTFDFKFNLLNNYHKYGLKNNRENKILVKTTLYNNYAIYSYLLINPTPFIRNIDNIFYYHKFNFDDRFIRSNALVINNAYLYIIDPLNQFKYISKTLDSKNLNKKYIEVEFKNIDSNFYFNFKKQFYYDPVTNLMYEEYKNNLLLVNNDLYMPIKYYEEYKNTKLGIEFINFYNGMFNFYFEFEISLLNNYLKNEVTISKTIEKVVENVPYKEVNI